MLNPSLPVVRSVHQLGLRCDEGTWKRYSGLSIQVQILDLKVHKRLPFVPQYLTSNCRKHTAISQSGGHGTERRPSLTGFSFPCWATIHVVVVFMLQPVPTKQITLFCSTGMKPWMHCLVQSTYPIALAHVYIVHRPYRKLFMDLDYGIALLWVDGLGTFKNIDNSKRFRAYDTMFDSAQA